LFKPNSYAVPIYIDSFPEKISFGVFKEKSRLELKGNPLAKLNFTDFLTPA